MDEKTLIERAAKGDGQAFSELMAAQEGRMYAVALRMCGHREDAQDCLQGGDAARLSLHFQF